MPVPGSRNLTVEEMRFEVVSISFCNFFEVLIHVLNFVVTLLGCFIFCMDFGAYLWIRICFLKGGF